MWIVFEGPEATGKSTQAKLLKEALEKRGKRVLLTKEPGTPHNQVCVKIRDLLLSPENNLTQETALFLFLADRSQHMRQVVLPALNKGEIVISDRSSLSTFFYYLAERNGYDEDYMCYAYSMLFEALAEAQDYRKADICFITKANHDWAKENMISRGGLDRIEQKGDILHQNIHKYFNSLNIQENLDELKEEAFFPKDIHILPSIPDFSTDQVAEVILSKVLFNL